MMTRRLTSLLICIPLAAIISGCAAFRSSVRDQDPDTASALTAKYDYKDLRALGEQVSSDLANHPFLMEHAKKHAETPIIAPLGIQNRTKSHIDMQALEDTITTPLLNTRKVQLVNTKRRDDLMREQGFQLQNVTPETRAAIGKQLGAAYMLTGSLVEIERESGREVRVSKKQDVYYQLTVEVTDLETSLIAARVQKERLRRASKPLIGW